MPTFSANLGFLFGDQTLPQAIRSAHQAGFAAVECHWPYDVDPAEVREALEETLRTGRVCYYSRSRQALWRKGEQSGNQQHLREARLDCDGDTVLLLVDQSGPACHTGREHCFYLHLGQEQSEVTEPVMVDPSVLYGPKA